MKEFVNPSERTGGDPAHGHIGGGRVRHARRARSTREQPSRRYHRSPGRDRRPRSGLHLRRRSCAPERAPAATAHRAGEACDR